MNNQNYAVVKVSGHQFKVTEGMKIRAGFMAGADIGTTVPLSEVLLLSKNGDVKVGQPFVAGAQVTAQVDSHGREDKILVFKYLRKNKLKKLYGHRQPFTTLSITTIEG